LNTKYISTGEIDNRTGIHQQTSCSEAQPYTTGKVFADYLQSFSNNSLQINA